MAEVAARISPLTQQWRQRTAKGGALFLRNLLDDTGAISSTLSADSLRLAYTELLAARDRALFAVDHTMLSLVVWCTSWLVVFVAGIFLTDELEQRTGSVSAVNLAIGIPETVLAVLVCVFVFRRSIRLRSSRVDFALCQQILPFLREKLASGACTAEQEVSEAVDRGRHRVTGPEFGSVYSISGSGWSRALFTMFLGGLITAICYCVVNTLWNMIVVTVPTVVVSAKETKV